MVLLTEKNNFLAASCCNVEVVKGPVGLFLAGLVSFDATLNCALTFCAKKVSTFSALSKVVFKLALINLLPLVKNSACVLNIETGTKAFISLSRSTISRTETDCTRPADKPPFTFRHNTGDNSYPTKRSSTRRACCAFTRL